LKSVDSLADKMVSLSSLVGHVVDMVLRSVVIAALAAYSSPSIGSEKLVVFITDPAPPPKKGRVSPRL
jgi:hypothetical protein